MIRNLSLREALSDRAILNSLSATLFASVAVFSAVTLGRSITAKGWGAWFNEQWPLMTSPVASTIFNVNMLWKYWAAILAVELIFGGWHRSTLHALFVKRDRSAWFDVLSFVGMLGFNIGMFTFTLLTFAAFTNGNWYASTFGSVNIVQWVGTPVLQFTAAILAADLAAYFSHRWCHKWEWAWRLHAMHHSATSFNMFTLYRMNPIELGVAGVLSAFVAAPLGGSLHTFAATLVALQLLRQVQLLWLHMNVDWDFGWFGRWVLVSPMYHRVHHLKDPAYHDANYSQFLVIWDRLFRTYVDARSVKNWELGIEEKTFSRSYPVVLLYSLGSMLYHFGCGIVHFPIAIATIARAARRLIPLTRTVSAPADPVPPYLVELSDQP